jgi:hypothetical protein
MSSANVLSEIRRLVEGNRYVITAHAVKRARSSAASASETS